MDSSASQIQALLEAQQDYWSQLTDGKPAMSPAELQDWISQAQSTVNQEGPKQFSQLLSILRAQAKNFTEFGEEVLRQYRGGDDTSLNDAVLQFQNYMQKQSGELLLHQWQVPEQFASLFKTHSFSDDLLFENPFISGIKSLLETPVVGSNQETQQQLREALKLLIEYQEALHEYVEHYGSINQQASSKLLQQLTASEGKVTSLQALHDLWVEAYESAYSITVLTDEYQRAHGRISNALMQLRKFVQEVRDIHFQSIGLATRRGLDTALQRQHKLRKEMRVTQRDFAHMQAQLLELQQNSNADIIQALQQEVAQLRKEVKQLRTPKGASKA
ncbi:poly(R)-hydroxyalkanoic acid synthase subunit PhaE [Pontibacter sp. JAM-7]|uniref:poly(R)-hydroxyalkanoic acid synthase subunit PhaE n=1 Tax=Pontibacter sp. JAM-7 TaxID=3366581 RepID=UPI003AF82B89